jgi:hypothetical protein
MDELKESPRIDWLYGLAQKLRRAPGKLAEAAPILGAVAEASKEALTEPIARGLEHWAYGDRMFGPPANAPLVNQRTMDMAAAMPLGVVGQAPKGAALASLYAGTKRPELMLSHSVELSKLLRNRQLPKELYHTSFGIKDNALMTEFGPVTILPHLRKVDPKTQPVSVHAIDAWTPRYHNAASQRADELLDDLSPELVNSMSERQAILRANADARNADRLVSTFRGGGLGAEVASLSGAQSKTFGLPEYGQGGYRIGDSPMIWQKGNPQALQLQELSYGQRFPSFQKYEESPLGARRLTHGMDYERAYEEVADWIRSMPEIASKYRISEDERDLLTKYMGENPRVNTLLRDAMRGHKNFTPEQVEEARLLGKLLKRTNSQYAEAKHWGALQLNPENIAGIMADTRHVSGSMLKELERAGWNRGLPVVGMDYLRSKVKPAVVARELQDSDVWR